MKHVKIHRQDYSSWGRTACGERHQLVNSLSESDCKKCYRTCRIDSPREYQTRVAIAIGRPIEHLFPPPNTMPPKNN